MAFDPLTALIHELRAALRGGDSGAASFSGDPQPLPIVEVAGAAALEPPSPPLISHSPHPSITRPLFSTSFLFRSPSPLSSQSPRILQIRAIGRRISSAAAAAATSAASDPAQLRTVREDIKELLKTTFCHPILSCSVTASGGICKP